VIGCTMVVAGGYVLSAFGAFGSALGWLAGWCTVFAAGLVDASRRYRSKRASWYAIAEMWREIRRSPFARVALAGAAFVMSTSAVIGLMSAPSNWDGMTYHLARVNIMHEVPLLVVVPYRGDIGDPRWLGLYKKTTEPGLDAMDIPYRVVSRSADIVRTIKECNESARAWLKCIAVILNEEALW